MCVGLRQSIIPADYLTKIEAVSTFELSQLQLTCAQYPQLQSSDSSTTYLVT